MSLKEKSFTTWFWNVDTSKFRRTIVPMLSVVAALGAVCFMALISGVPLSKAIFGALRDPNPVNLCIALNGIVLALIVPFGVFILSRWSSVQDELTAMRHAFTAEVASMRDALKQVITLLAEKTGVQIVFDEASIWSGMVIRMILENAGLLSEVNIQIAAGGRYRIAVDEARIGNFSDRLKQNMTLIFVFYLPRNVVGENPAVSVLRLVHIVRVCRARAGLAGTTLNAKIRMIIIDAPRPIRSVFICNQEKNGTVKPIAREYFRELSAMVGDNTPTADRMLLEHHDSTGIEGLNELVKKAVCKGIEVQFSEVERLFGKLLPDEDGGTAPIITPAAWNRVVEALYQGAQASTYEAVSSPDGHLAFNQIRPSLTDARGLGDSIANPPPAEGGDQNADKAVNN